MAPEIIEIIQASLDAIEERLCTELDVRELAGAAGFSLYHFYHVFEAVTGTSVGRYITQRRLLHALWSMSCGQSATEAALNYGFDTHSGFYKAFRREFGCSPSEYLKSHRAARPLRVNLKEVPKMTDMKTVARALTEWNIEDAPVVPAYYANTGYRSESTFCVGDNYCIKVSRRPGELQRQAALHRALAAEKLAAPIVPAPGGDVLTMNGMDFLLMERVEGQPVDAVAVLKRPETARAIGEGLARLHAALCECDPLLCYTEDYAATLRNWAAPIVRGVIGEETWLDDYIVRIEQVFPRLPMQIVHRDPNPDNLLMKDGKVTGFLDFDLTRVLPRIFDLCYAATGILCDAWASVDSQQRMGFFHAARAIWEGYDAVSPLTDEEWRALPDMVLAIQLTCVAAFADSDKLAQLFEINREMLRFIKDNVDCF